MVLRPQLWGQPLPGRLLALGCGMAVLTALQRLLYPAAALLLSVSRPGQAMGLLAAALLFALLRAYLGDVAVHRLRERVYHRLGDTLRRLPVFWPPTLPPVEQLGPQVARGLPWVELHFCQTLPLLLGNALALPALGVLAWGMVDKSAVLLALFALCIAGAAASLTWGRARRAAADSWAAYKPISTTIDRGLRARLELRVHGLSQSYETTLSEYVKQWAGLEKKARRVRAFTGFSLPVFALAAAMLVAMALGFDVGPWFRAVLFERDRQVVGAGIVLVSAVPLLVGLSRGIANAAHERSYIQALYAVFNLPQQVAEGVLQAEGAVGEVVLSGTRFVFAREEEEPVVVGADLRWRVGESIALLGPNGCGKTSVALAVMGLLGPNAGTCAVKVGDEWNDTRALCGRVACLFQSSFFAQHETVLEAVRFLAPSASDSEVTLLFARLFPASSIDSLLKQRVSSLSAGQQRLVALARVLLRRSPLVVLDEPEANLDVDSVARVLEVLCEVSREQRLLILTHDSRFTEVAQRVLRFGNDRALRDPMLAEKGTLTQPEITGPHASNP